jgi:hypothetical protein
LATETRRPRRETEPGRNDAEGIGTQSRKAAKGREEAEGFRSLNRAPNGDRGSEPDSCPLLASLRFCPRWVFASSESFPLNVWRGRRRLRARDRGRRSGFESGARVTNVPILPCCPESAGRLASAWSEG